MSEVKTKPVKMLRNARGCPAGHTVVDYVDGQIIKDMPTELADAFIANGDAEALPEENAAVVVATWPPSDEEINALSFSALGVLLEQKGAPLGPLKSEDLRRAALRDIIESEIVVPWPAGSDTDKVPDKRLAQQLKAAGVDLSTLTTRDEAEAKYRELLGLPDETSDNPDANQTENQQ